MVTEVCLKQAISNSIILENERVRLEKLSLKHFDCLNKISNKTPNLLSFSPSPFGDEDSLKKYFNTALNTQNRFPFAIFDKAINNYVGTTSFGNYSKKDSRVEIGWTWINKSSQGTGLNKNCKFLLLKFCFENFNIERVEFKTDSRNTQSRKAIEKIGGKYEGELRNHTLMLDGHRRNTVYYSILKNEWKQLKDSIFRDINKTIHKFYI